MWIVHSGPHVREAVASVQRRKTTAVIAVVSGVTEASAIAAPPWVEEVTRANGEPSDRTPAATKADSKATAPAEERNISRRPERPVIRIRVKRTGPPRPSAVILQPATVVIGRPAPGVIGNPSPSPIRFVNPAAVAVGSPVGADVRLPYGTVI